MKKLLLLATCSLALVACQAPAPNDTTNNQSVAETIDEGSKHLQTLGITWSQLTDRQSRDYLTERLNRVGIPKEDQEFFWHDVDRFLQYTDQKQLTKKGLEPLPANFLSISGNFDLEKWQKKEPLFIGYNCRITSYGLLNHLLTIPKEVPADTDQLFMDLDAIEQSPEVVFNDDQLRTFQQLFSKVPTTNSTNQRDQIRRAERAVQDRHISFPVKEKGVTLGTVWLHSAFEDEEPFLFIGHAGILFHEEDGSILLLEKVAFDEPYQIVHFPTHEALNDYWMTKYDNNGEEADQSTARPFILENDQLMEGFRPSINL